MNEIEYKIHVDKVIEKIELARLNVSAHHIVKIVAVSKYSDNTEIEALYNIGQRAFGENKVQDLKLKSSELEELPLEWHFIGNLQKNKINQLLEINPFLFQSLDSLELAHALQKRLNEREMTLDSLLQINSANEQSKHGVTQSHSIELYRQIEQECPNINLRGVMSIGAHSDDRKTVQQSFEATHKIFETLDAEICSMGMSGDYELAIACGSNMVRLGTAVFPK
ncbi:MAG: YggS family pyridoxal phosphate-dependent enzyme [Campylobacterota bacterium]|nr:YggS family pyridoxal phosphate-dependent enzyme [Campylobacterota bacterium]